MNDYEYRKLKQSIRRHTGIDLDNYKAQQMRRRLDGYVGRSEDGSVKAFLETLDRDREAVWRLKEFITINVSEFFRDAAQFNLLKSVALPDLLRSAHRLNVWSAGCSHGGEPYSVAMLLEDLTPGVNHRILATDLDEAVLARARAGGPYRASDVKNVSRGHLIRHFEVRGGEYWVKDEIRRRVVFRQQDLLRDRFDRGLDLIICRNVVIYFSDEAKEALNRRFHRALKPTGWLFIGGTETLLGSERIGFERARASLYRKTVPAPARAAA